MKAVIRVLALPVALIGSLLSVPALAGNIDADLFGGNCSGVARELHDLMRANPESLCVGDLDVASAFIESADVNLRRDKITEALASIDKGAYELTDISFNRTHCQSLAPGVKHVLADLIRVRGEIEAFMRLRIKAQVTH